MNDFTKDELKLIIEAVLDLRGSCLDYAEETQELKIKIQKMIDRCCDHEWNIDEVMKKIILNPGLAFAVECKKCGIPYRW